MARRTKSPASATPHLADIAPRLFAGRFASLPDQVTINFKDISKADFITLLEMARYRMDGHDILKRENFESELQGLKTNLNSGKFQHVLETLRAKPDLDDEMILQKGRAHIFLGELSETVETLLPLIMNSSTSTLMRGVAAQLVAHAYMEQARLDDSLELLGLALDCAERVGNTLGRVSAHFFRSKVYAFLNDGARGQMELDKGFSLLTQGVGGFRWLLAYYRHSAHFNFIIGNSKAINHSKMAVLISRELNDTYFEAKGLIELGMMERRYGLNHVSSNVELQNLIEKEVLKKNLELARWHETFTTGRISIDATLTLKVFAQLSMHADDATMQANDKQDNFILSRNPGCQWAFDTASGTLTDLAQGSIVSVGTSSRFAKIISELNVSNDMHLSEFFESVWNVKWSADRIKVFCR